MFEIFLSGYNPLLKLFSVIFTIYKKCLRVKWLGSHPPIPTTGTICSHASKELWDDSGSKSKITRDSTSKTKYRHFAYDSTHKIVYFCDLNPYKEGMFCFCSDRNEDGNVWNGKFS